MLNYLRDTDGRKLLSEVASVQNNPVSVFSPVVSPKSKPVESTQKANNLLGGKTPDEMARMMLKVIQNNNINDWIRFIHPATDKEMRDRIIKKLSEHRTHLEEQGLADWSQVEFGRSSFQYRKKGDDEVGVGKIAIYFTVEFYYKKREYRGNIDLGPIATEPDKGIYYLIAPGLGRTQLYSNTGIFR